VVVGVPQWALLFEVEGTDVSLLPFHFCLMRSWAKGYVAGSRNCSRTSELLFSPARTVNRTCHPL